MTTVAQTPKTPHFWPNLSGKVAPEAELAVKMLFNVQQEHDQAIVALKQQLTAAVLAKTTVNQTAAASTSAVAASSSSNLGLVNNQTGMAYTTMASDNGALVTLDNAAAVALTLNSSMAPGFVAFFENLGVGLATLTPASGTINGVAAIVLGTGQSCFVAFDGVNFWAATDPQGAQSAVVVVHEFLTGYAAGTGLFTAAQPAFGDVTGVAAVAQIPTLPESQIIGLTADLSSKAPLAGPTFTGTVTQPGPAVLTAATTAMSATAGAATALPTTPAGYLVVSVNGTNYKLPYFAM